MRNWCILKARPSWFRPLRCTYTCCMHVRCISCQLYFPNRRQLQRHVCMGNAQAVFAQIPLDIVSVIPTQYNIFVICRRTKLLIIKFCFTDMHKHAHNHCMYCICTSGFQRFRRQHGNVLYLHGTQYQYIFLYVVWLYRMLNH